MSKEIDFSKAPEGATHYSIPERGEIIWYKDLANDNYKFYWNSRISKGGNADAWQCGTGKPYYWLVSIPDKWSIYTNDKPLCELTDEQVGKLVKHSGCVEHMNPNSGKWGVTISPTWNRYGVYRIKQKSERELFIEAAMDLMTSETERTLEQMFGALFDSGKFKLVEQPK